MRKGFVKLKTSLDWIHLNNLRLSQAFEIALNLTTGPTTFLSKLVLN